MGDSSQRKITSLPRDDSTEALRQFLQTYKFASVPEFPCAVEDDVKPAPIHDQQWLFQWLLQMSS
jgi:hypothetical protein